jgi:tetratricopeptide (TPR) repeat protein
LRKSTELEDQTELVRARPLFERALAINEKVLGPEHPTTNYIRLNFARLLIDNGDPAEALVCSEAALAAGEDQPWSKDAARITAHALDALGRAEDAVALRARYPR